MSLEGKLLSIGIEPGAKEVLGITIITAEGGQQGRYLARPESVYGTISWNGESVPNLQDLLDRVLLTPLVRVRLIHEAGYDYFRIADFTGEK